MPHACQEIGPICASDPGSDAQHGALTPDRCISLCTEQLTNDPLRAANWHSHPASCAEAWSAIEAPRLATPALCTAFCERAEACGYSELLHYGGGRDACAAYCAGDLNRPGSETLAAELQCVAEALSGGCDFTRVRQCVDFIELECNHVCGGFTGHVLSCQAWTPYVATFVDYQSCMTRCRPLRAEDVVAVARCVGTAGCLRAASCWPPRDPAKVPACKPYCEGLLARCPNIAGIPGQAFCEAWCASQQSLTPAFPSCLPELDQCPVDVSLLLCH